MTPETISQRKTKLACWLRDGLIKLGPTFIKIGQQFSTRVDVLSPEFIKELEQLQDSVPAFDSADAVAIVERDLGAPVTTIYDEFDTEPIAAASLGQVRPVLRSTDTTFPTPQVMNVSICLREDKRDPGSTVNQDCCCAECSFSTAIW
jgi:hypothetical protein